MNINWNRKYFTIAVYATCAVIVSAIAVMVIFNFDSVMAKLSVLGAVTTPIIIGIFCAYLLNPLMTRIETGPLKSCRIPRTRKPEQGAGYRAYADHAAGSCDTGSDSYNGDTSAY